MVLGNTGLPPCSPLSITPVSRTPLRRVYLLWGAVTLGNGIFSNPYIFICGYCACARVCMVWFGCFSQSRRISNPITGFILPLSRTWSRTVWALKWKVVYANHRIWTPASLFIDMRPWTNYLSSRSLSVLLRKNRNAITSLLKLKWRLHVIIHIEHLALNLTHSKHNVNVNVYSIIGFYAVNPFFSCQNVSSLRIKNVRILDMDF